MWLAWQGRNPERCTAASAHQSMAHLMQVLVLSLIALVVLAKGASNADDTSANARTLLQERGNGTLAVDTSPTNTRTSTRNEQSTTRRNDPSRSRPGGAGQCVQNPSYPATFNTKQECENGVGGLGGCSFSILDCCQEAATCNPLACDCGERERATCGCCQVDGKFVCNKCTDSVHATCVTNQASAVAKPEYLSLEECEPNCKTATCEGLACNDQFCDGLLCGCTQSPPFTCISCKDFTDYDHIGECKSLAASAARMADSADRMDRAQNPGGEAKAACFACMVDGDAVIKVFDEEADKCEQPCDAPYNLCVITQNYVKAWKPTFGPLPPGFSTAPCQSTFERCIAPCQSAYAEKVKNMFEYRKCYEACCTDPFWTFENPPNPGVRPKPSCRVGMVG